MDSMLYQVSLLQALALGEYDGFITIGELRSNGNIGIGTFDGLDGEMIMLNGIVYKASADGSVTALDDDAKTPFANVTFASDDLSKNVTARSLKELSDELDSTVASEGINSVYFIRLDGLFDSIRVRSVPKQKRPYRRLADALTSEQVEWTLKDVRGTVVGLYCPSYMSAVNNHGWHLHFISDDRKKGGHVLDLSVKEGGCAFTAVDALKIVLPDDHSFHSLDLSVDQEKDIKRIEGTE